MNPNTEELLRIIDEELRHSNIFVNRLLDCAKAYGWGHQQKLAQMVVILARENNRLQDDLLKAAYAKAFPEPIVIPVVNADNVKPLLEAAYYYGERTGDYGMQDINGDDHIMQLIADINHPMTKGVVMDEARAREILGDAITPDGRIVLVSDWYEFNDNHKPPLIIEGELSLEQLEAITWWMRNKQ
ncbi:hypothetical protein [Arsukibacterium indicum]|uniref:Uncharacterized protein n=1 Tax=Arsukibacterium indicum TaxID=2848612 RepID=A0ABS6MH74_9GAMM|nr:hypothetical protein [Arsukibacterium indicum]MBV2128176.1 hypothetical protein [Arsukibacterium indicum]